MRLGPRHNQTIIRDIGTGDKGLFPRQAEPVAPALGQCGGLHRIGSGTRFGDRKTELDLALAGRRKKLLLVELGPVAGDMGQRHGRPDHHHKKRNAVIGGAFHEQGHFGHAKAGTAVFLGDHDAQKPVIGDLAEHIVREFMLAGMVEPIRIVVFLRQLAAIFVNLALLVVESEIHGSSSALESGGAAVFEGSKPFGDVIA